MKMYLFTDGEMTNNKHLSDVSEQISQVKKDSPICKTIKNIPLSLPLSWEWTLRKYVLSRINAPVNHLKNKLVLLYLCFDLFIYMDKSLKQQAWWFFRYFKIGKTFK